MKSHYRLETLAGTTQGSEDGELAASRFSRPRCVCADGEGNLLIADSDNHRIRRVGGGRVETVAGGERGWRDGPAQGSQFHYPSGICADREGNVIVCDFNNHKIRKILKNGTVETLAGSSQGCKDGPASSSQFNGPYGVCLDEEGNIIVTDFNNHKIRRILKSGDVETLAGSSGGYQDGLAGSSKFNYPFGVCLDREGDIIVSEFANHKIRRIRKSGIVETVAGSSAGFQDGDSGSAQFNIPCGVCVDREGNILVADYANHRIRRIKGRIVETIAGNAKGCQDGNQFTSQLNFPYGVCVDEEGDVIVADTYNHRIRRIVESERESEKAKKAKEIQTVKEEYEAIIERLQKENEDNIKRLKQEHQKETTDLKKEIIALKTLNEEIQAQIHNYPKPISQSTPLETRIN